MLSPALLGPPPPRRPSAARAAAGLALAASLVLLAVAVAGSRTAAGQADLDGLRAAALRLAEADGAVDPTSGRFVVGTEAAATRRLLQGSGGWATTPVYVVSVRGSFRWTGPWIGRSPGPPAYDRQTLVLDARSLRLLVQAGGGAHDLGRLGRTAQIDLSR